MVVTTDIVTGKLAELVKQVQAGNEVLVTEGNKPVARIIAASGTTAPSDSPLKVRSLSGHKVLTPIISQEELADDLFRQR